MTSIITGDIIDSQKSNPHDWMEKLKAELDKIGKNPGTWEIYRGDSFQVEVMDITRALETAIKIKAALKCIKKIDVRMAIGLGDKNYQASKITESNGSAFVNSGEIFEKLVKQKQNLAIASPSEAFNQEMNLLLRLALIVMDNWTVNSAEVVHLALCNPGFSQKQLGDILKIRQNAVSTRLKRARFDEISDLLGQYQTKITHATH